MTITERTLRNWRREALVDQIHPMPFEGNDVENVRFLTARVKQISERILRLTQDQLDLYLIRPRH